MPTPEHSHTPLILATTIAGGTLAYADPVRFDNDGSFQWTDGVYLDMTASVRNQTGSDTGKASFRYQRILSTCCAPHEDILLNGATPDAQVEGYPSASVRDLGARVPIDFAGRGGREWHGSQPLGYYYNTGASFYTGFEKIYIDGVASAPGYVAARFDLADGTHYGWMSFTLTWRPGPAIPDWEFDLLAWGYETDPDTRILAGALPAPGGALAALALGAAAGMTRGRRLKT